MDNEVSQQKFTNQEINTIKRNFQEFLETLDVEKTREWLKENKVKFLEKRISELEKKNIPNTSTTFNGWRTYPCGWKINIS